jgi:hypothetical protein
MSAPSEPAGDVILVWNGIVERRAGERPVAQAGAADDEPAPEDGEPADGSGDSSLEGPGAGLRRA